MPPEDLRARLVHAGLDRYADALIGLARRGIRLVPDPPGGNEGARTRLGGEPDLPEDAQWPSFHGAPLAFVAQIELSDMAPFDVEGTLPRSGLLSFFYEGGQQVWGFDPADRGAWAVHLSPADAPLGRRVAPPGLAGEARYAPVPLRGVEETVYAPWESSEVFALGLSRDELFAYAEVLDEEDLPIHRLLGHPEPIQGDMQLECQLASNGIYCGDPTGYNDPRADVLRAGAVDWRLLLQVDSDDDAGMMWGDLGRIYYWIRKGDLAARAWDTAWLILQCT